jgi:type IV pilus assembly protein PilE
MHLRNRGFTLMELVIAIVVIGILLAVAIPAYTDQVRKSRRAQAKADLQELAQIYERHFTNNSSYDDPVVTLPFTVSPRMGNSFYDITVDVDAAQFELTATPSGDQVDDRCGTLTLNHAGSRTPTTAGCWN